MTLFDKCRKYQRANQAREIGRLPYFTPIADCHGGTEVTIDGKRMVMAGSNNYLGLTHDARVIEASKQAIDKYGTGCSGSRLLNGTMELHHRLEEKLARFLGKEAALVFSTGFQTNLGILSVLAGREDIIFCDRENHASIFDGTRLSYAAVRKYRHSDMDELERLLADADPARGKLIVTDGVFSMLGDLAELPTIQQLALRYDARVLLDDAHGIGVVGPGGRGTAAHFGLDVDLISGTFSKSLASLGGFVAGPAEVIEFIKCTARSMIFSAACPPSNTAAAITALEILESEPERVDRVLHNTEYMRAGFRELGYEIPDGESAIVPLHVGSDHDTFARWNMLFDAGLFVNSVVTPAVPPGQGMLRTSYMATHTRAQLDRCLEIIREVDAKILVQ